MRLISGRNSPIYSSGITDPLKDIALTGQSVLDIYNNRIEKAEWDHDDIRLVVLIRNMKTREFTIFERPIAPLVVNNCRWELNKNSNLTGFNNGDHVFTWQPHGSQFTIHEPVPPGATRFRIKKEPGMLEMKHVLRLVRFKPDWVEIVSKPKPLDLSDF